MLTLARAKTFTVARGGVNVAPGQTSTLRLRLTKTGRRYLKGRKRAKLRITVELKAAGSPNVRITRDSVLRR